MNNPETFLNEAIKLSRIGMNSDHGGPFGAIIVKNGEIIGRGWNKVTSSNDPTAHAEVVAIREACKTLNTYKLEGCEIYTSCEPCPMCLSAIYWARIEKIYFANTRQDAANIGFDDEFLYEELKLDLNQRKIPSEQLLKTQANLVFQEWNEKEDKEMY